MSAGIGSFPGVTVASLFNLFGTIEFVGAAPTTGRVPTAGFTGRTGFFDGCAFTFGGAGVGAGLANAGFTGNGVPGGGGVEVLFGTGFVLTAALAFNATNWRSSLSISSLSPSAFAFAYLADKSFHKFLTPGVNVSNHPSANSDSVKIPRAIR